MKNYFVKGKHLDEITDVLWNASKQYPTSISQHRNHVAWMRNTLKQHYGLTDDDFGPSWYQMEKELEEVVEIPSPQDERLKKINELWENKVGCDWSWDDGFAEALTFVGYTLNPTTNQWEKSNNE